MSIRLPLMVLPEICTGPPLGLQLLCFRNITIIALYFFSHDVKQPKKNLVLVKIVFCQLIVLTAFHADGEIFDEEGRFCLKQFKDKFEGIW